MCPPRPLASSRDASQSAIVLKTRSPGWEGGEGRGLNDETGLRDGGEGGI